MPGNPLNVPQEPAQIRPLLASSLLYNHVHLIILPAVPRPRRVCGRGAGEARGLERSADLGNIGNERMEWVVVSSLCAIRQKQSQR